MVSVSTLHTCESNCFPRKGSCKGKLEHLPMLITFAKTKLEHLSLFIPVAKTGTTLERLLLTVRQTFVCHSCDSHCRWRKLECLYVHTYECMYALLYVHTPRSVCVYCVVHKLMGAMGILENRNLYLPF